MNPYNIKSVIEYIKTLDYPYEQLPEKDISYEVININLNFFKIDYYIKI
jgi:hypothetical protein